MSKTLELETYPIITLTANEDSVDLELGDPWDVYIITSIDKKEAQQIINFLTEFVGEK